MQKVIDLVQAGGIEHPVGETLGEEYAATTRCG
jgi:hypothetical protein